MPQGRPKGNKGGKWTKPQYVLRYLDIDDDVPIWVEHECPTYEYMQQLLLNKYNERFSRDMLQNIRLNRNNKFKQYRHIQIKSLN